MSTDEENQNEIQEDDLGEVSEPSSPSTESEINQTRWVILVIISLFLIGATSIAIFLPVEAKDKWNLVNYVIASFIGMFGTIIGFYFKEKSK